VVRDAQLLGLEQVERDDAVGQDVPGAFGVELQAVAAGQDLGGEQLGARLASLGGDPRGKLIGAIGKQTRSAIEIVGALAEARGAPIDLRLAGALDGGAYVVGAVDLELAERLERGGIREAQAPAFTRRGLDPLDHCHPLPLATPMVFARHRLCPWRASE
jgi:hypothetical protein